MSDRRLIEVAFPLRETSLDSVHEKNVRHGHISTLHIWPARRPLAACRAALIATLLPDPDDDDERKEILLRMAGEVVEEEDDEGVIKTTTRGGILHWGRESGADLEWFRAKIRAAYGGRAPRVLDPFSGGGAIPLEAMRLGCEAIAADINPVAWFLLKCTLQYPQGLAGQTRALPAFAIADTAFIEEYRKAKGATRPKLPRLRKGTNKQEGIFAGAPTDLPLPDADLAWHLRAWSGWVQSRASSTLNPYYPAYADLIVPATGELLDFRYLASSPQGPQVAVDEWNDILPSGWRFDSKSPRWVLRPTAAYLWARTVPCKKCSAIIPLFKTAWLSKKEGRRARLVIHREPSQGTAPPEVRFEIETGGAGGRERGKGTMSRSGAHCPSCGAAMPMEDLRQRGRDGMLGVMMTAVVVNGLNGREHRLPRQEERHQAEAAADATKAVFARLPFGVPTEPIGSGDSLGISVPLYGFDQWYKLFTPRQLLALGTFSLAIREASEQMGAEGYPDDWRTALTSLLALRLDRLADRCSTICRPDPSPTQSGIMNTYARFALPLTWDFIEGVTTAAASGGWEGDTDWISLVVEHLSKLEGMPAATVTNRSSSMAAMDGDLDAVITDPPYYGAIGYSALMDFFYVWLRRILFGAQGMGESFQQPMCPKWDHASGDGELIDDPARFHGNRGASKAAYEDGMARTFKSAWSALKPEGRLVVVFANKQPDAWETLVSAIIRAGFVVTGSWPIQTERQARTRSLSSAALASSVWLVCRKRPVAARPGWDNLVLDEMRANIGTRLRQFWDDRIRGPDFVWAATGPAMEAYSKYPVVKKADKPGETMGVGEFLKHARKLVVEYVCARVLTPSGEADSTVDIDAVTAYYLLHRSSFGVGDVPVGPCILFAVSCGLSDAELADTWDVLERKGGEAGGDDAEDHDDGDGDDEASGTGAKVHLKAWDCRTRKGLGDSAPGGRAVPLIDRIHRAAQLRRGGDEAELNRFLHEHALGRNETFLRVLQALIELAEHDSTERAEFETLARHIATDRPAPSAPTLFSTLNSR